MILIPTPESYPYFAAVLGFQCLLRVLFQPHVRVLILHNTVRIKCSRLTHDLYHLPIRYHPYRVYSSWILHYIELYWLTYANRILYKSKEYIIYNGVCAQWRSYRTSHRHWISTGKCQLYNMIKSSHKLLELTFEEIITLLTTRKQVKQVVFRHYIPG